LEILREKRYVSGEKLAKELGVSRSAVWKHINNLREQGYNIESRKGRGYKLVSHPDYPTREEILSRIKTNIIGRGYYYYPILDSTNTHAKTFVEKKSLEGTIIVAEEQKHGRGRKSRNWFSPPNGLWFSIILYPRIPPDYSMIITMAFSVAIAEAIEELLEIKPRIKWPNDLLINNKKVCGILTEIDAELDEIHHLIVGVGLNVNNDLDDSIRDIATSLKLEYGKPISRILLFQRIIEKLDYYYQRVIDKDYDLIREKWFQYSNILGKDIKVSMEDKTIYGRVVDVDTKGRLHLITEGGKIEVIAGDIEYI
ncbi:MAG: biotin--[acetyl-CoA-carboxylase] ligase, partial [Thermoplasmata archaeon]